MSPESLIALGGSVILPALLFLLAGLRTHIRKDQDFQEESSKNRAVLDEKVKHLEQDFQNLHHWKNHELHDIISRSKTDVERRLEIIERRVMNGVLK